MSEEKEKDFLGIFIEAISLALDKLVKLHEDIAESLNEISEFLYNKDDAKVLHNDMQKAVKTVETIISDKKEPIQSVSDKIFDIYIKSETEKALLIKSNTTNLVAWIPRKAIKTLTTDYLELQDWFKGKVKWNDDKSI